MAAREGAFPNSRDAVRDDDAGESRAIIEGILPDFRDPFGDDDAGEFGVVFECSLADFRDRAVANFRWNFQFLSLPMVSRDGDILAKRFNRKIIPLSVTGGSCR